MTNDEIAEILAKPYAQQLLNGPEPARMAYIGLDGHPRVIPIGFWIDGGRVAMATVPKSAKVAALQHNPNVALTTLDPDVIAFALTLHDTFEAGRERGSLAPPPGTPPTHLSAQARLLHLLGRRPG